MTGITNPQTTRFVLSASNDRHHDKNTEQCGHASSRQHCPLDAGSVLWHPSSQHRLTAKTLCQFWEIFLFGCCFSNLCDQILIIFILTGRWSKVLGTLIFWATVWKCSFARGGEVSRNKTLNYLPWLFQVKNGEGISIQLSVDTAHRQAWLQHTHNTASLSCVPDNNLSAFDHFILAHNLSLHTLRCLGFAVCRDCLGRTPFGSLIATFVTLVCVAVFCATLYRALDITLRGIFESLFNFPIPWQVFPLWRRQKVAHRMKLPVAPRVWRLCGKTLRLKWKNLCCRLESIQIGFIVIAVVMGLYAIILLVFGFLATGATRQNIYSGAKCIMGGRLSAGFVSSHESGQLKETICCCCEKRWAGQLSCIASVLCFFQFMILTYFLNIIWMCVTSMCAIPIVIYVMLRSICHWEIEDREIWYYENYCFNLSRFGELLIVSRSEHRQLRPTILSIGIVLFVLRAKQKIKTAWLSGIYTNLKPLSLYIEDPGSIKNAICEDHELGELCQRVSAAVHPLQDQFFATERLESSLYDLLLVAFYFWRVFLQVADAGPMYGLAFGASLIIVLALVSCIFNIISSGFPREASSELNFGLVMLLFFSCVDFCAPGIMTVWLLRVANLSLCCTSTSSQI